MPSLHFLYHELRPQKSRYTYAVSTEEFRTHCEVYARLRETRTDKGPEGRELFRPEITFDDGHRSDLEVAAPALSEFGLKANFFITAGWTESRPEYMGWAELRSLQAAGHRIGAHGMTHTLLTACSPAALQQEVEGARLRLEDGLGAPVTTMSLPGGRANRQVLEACKSAGYTQVFTSVPGVAAMEDHPFTVGRLNLVSGTTPEWLARVLNPDTGLLRRLERIQAAKTATQQLLGDRLYARLWNVVNRRSERDAEAEASAA